jgi:molybdopterin-guanine dinucleotide biosynthesis protein A
MSWTVPSEIGGFVLAGGRSVRMGRDKAMLELGGKPLVLHAVVKMRRVCMEVSILGSDPALDAFAPLVRDVHPGCGPMSGMEAALLHTRFDWNLFLPVDVPFLPTAFVDYWVRFMRPRAAERGARVMMFMADGMPQPTVTLIHREICPYLTRALEEGRYKLLPVLEAAAREISVREGRLPGVGMWNLPYQGGFRSMAGLVRAREDWVYTTEAQEKASGIWFRNLNTPEEFAEAEAHLDVLDT